jgi:transposase
MKVALSSAERTRLRGAMQRTASARLYRRLQAVLLAGEGYSAAGIGALTGASARSVQHWCTRWRRSFPRRQPEKVLGEPPRRGRRPVVPTLDRARLLSELAKDPLSLGYAAANWTVPLLVARPLRQRCRLSVSARTLRRRLHAAGLRWKRPRFVFAKPEPHPAQKKGRSCAC